MVLKVDQPLYSDSASGRVRGLGSFRTTSTGTFLVVDPPAPTTPNTAQQQQRNSFADAKAAHSLIEPTSVYLYGAWRMLRIPYWRDFWATWRKNNPGWSSRRATVSIVLDSFTLTASATIG